MIRKHLILTALIAGVWGAGHRTGLSQTGNNASGHSKAVRKVTVELGNSKKVELILALIPAGSFEKKWGGKTEKFTVSKPFWLGTHEVTQAQWAAVMGSNPSRFRGPTRPVDSVSWYDCQQFVKKLNERIKGPKFFIPTAAQWQHACQAGTGNATGFPNISPKDYGKYAWATGRGTQPVGKLLPNAWGLYDMNGNVAEWTTSESGKPGSETRPATAPKTAMLGGTSWIDSDESNYGPTFIGWNASGATRRDFIIGFRIARELPEAPAMRITKVSVGVEQTRLVALNGLIGSQYRLVQWPLVTNTNVVEASLDVYGELQLGIHGLKPGKATVILHYQVRNADRSSWTDRIRLFSVTVGIFEPIKAKRVAYVVDCSGSMKGERFERARRELLHAIRRLTPQQKFYVIFFTSKAYPMSVAGAAAGDLLPATPANVELITKWAMNCKAGGGTNPQESLLRALALKPETVVFLTDGQFDKRIVDIVRQKNVHRAKIKTIAFGSRAGEPLLKKIAAENNGTYRFVK